MAKSAVYSVRIGVQALAQCYDLLELSGVQTANLPAASCMRMVLEAVTKQLAERKAIPRYTDKQADARLGNVVSPPPVQLFEPGAPIEQPEEPCEQVTSPSPPSEKIITDPDAREAARRKVHQMLQPQIDAAREEQDRRRFDFVGEYEGAKAREGKPVSVLDIPPWKQAVLATTDEFDGATKVSTLCQVIAEHKDQLAALAMRIILPHITEDMLNRDTEKQLFNKVYRLVADYIETHPQVDYPLTFTDEPKADEVGITMPPEDNQPE